MDNALRQARANFSWGSAFTFAVPIVVSLVANYAASKLKLKPEPPPALYLPVLKDNGFTPRTYPVTYRLDPVEFQNYERVLNATTNVPDTTAVLLNWARFPNVLLITTLLCGSWLDDTIAGVVIWNNSPKILTYEDFKHTGCPKDKLHIHNAPGNAYFQGRFLGCAAAKTPYCYIQDDDYLVRAEIIRSLRARVADADDPHTIHLLPSHEHLSSSLREIHVQKPDLSYLSDIHTSFAWLGHGTMMHRSRAEEFLSLMRYLRASPDELQMADNYFTILSNRVPEIWFDQSFELGGGNAFTVGDEGHQRNAKHILRATQYLDSLARCGAASCDPGAQAKPARMTVPYVSLADTPPRSRWTRAACSGASCIVETNIRLLPDSAVHTADSVEKVLTVEDQNLALLGTAGKQEYEDHPLSHAVDTRPDTAFRSFANGRAGDIVVLDILGDISDAHGWQAVEMVWLVDADTEEILHASTFESSVDNENWRQAVHRPVCDDVTTSRLDENDDFGKAHQRECSVQVILTSNDLHLRATGRYFRAKLQEDRQQPWVIFEIWLRGLSLPR
ncbi:uncharacterized protein B0H18DRAFT_995571 [Fomitopsis serialis]|uniref:uncharacterized protein n=1 Tax=Fomitopsis serialis TaxID=139415 RepID=UPI002007A457|nr:uncharacterized protein B0H18DRAFT_995571 [Neoantrodia serialis]KAH9929659.1 hypothetical protein B0H18DRAFT_995571 [Neoantrodia serialis]